MTYFMKNLLCGRIRRRIRPTLSRQQKWNTLSVFQNSKITWSKAINDWALVLSPEIIWVLTLRSLHFCVLFYQLLRMPRNTRLFFANFTVFFHLVTVFTDHVPILLIEIVVIFLVGFSFITDVRHTLNPRQRWYMDWLIDSIVYVEITKKRSRNANHLSYCMSHNTTKNISTPP